MKFAATSCSDCSDSRRPSLYQMEEMGVGRWRRWAWVLRSDRRRKTIGFVTAGQLEDDERHVLDG